MAVAIGARPSDGSSARNTAGGSARATARASCCCSPPDRSPASWLRRSAEDREALVGGPSGRRASAGGWPGCRRPRARGRRHGPRAPGARPARARRCGCVRGDLGAAEQHPAGGGGDEPGGHGAQGRLAGAVGPEHRDHRRRPGPPGRPRGGPRPRRSRRGSPRSVEVHGAARRPRRPLGALRPTGSGRPGLRPDRRRSARRLETGPHRRTAERPAGAPLAEPWPTSARTPSGWRARPTAPRPNSSGGQLGARRAARGAVSGSEHQGAPVPVAADAGQHDREDRVDEPGHHGTARSADAEGDRHGQPHDAEQRRGAGVGDGAVDQGEERAAEAGERRPRRRRGSAWCGPGRRPTVVAATDDERSASTDRPVADRWRLPTSPTTSGHHHDQDHQQVLVVAEVERTVRRAGHRPARADPLRTSSSWKKRRSPMNASASVARARVRPPRRSEGRATSTPTSGGHHHRGEGGHPEHEPPVVHEDRDGAGELVVDRASRPRSPPMVTKAAWARLIIPPRPVTTTNDRKIRPRTRPRWTMPDQYESATNQPVGQEERRWRSIHGRPPTPRREVGPRVRRRGLLGDATRPLGPGPARRT